MPAASSSRLRSRSTWYSRSKYAKVPLANNRDSAITATNAAIRFALTEANGSLIRALARLARWRPGSKAFRLCRPAVRCDRLSPQPEARGLCRPAVRRDRRSVQPEARGPCRPAVRRDRRSVQPEARGLCRPAVRREWGTRALIASTYGQPSERPSCPPAARGGRLAWFGLDELVADAPDGLDAGGALAQFFA